MRRPPRRVRLIVRPGSATSLQITGSLLGRGQRVGKGLLSIASTLCVVRQSGLVGHALGLKPLQDASMQFNPAMSRHRLLYC